jgi:membrane protein implicated in regulation of membrane protease activity
VLHSFPTRRSSDLILLILQWLVVVVLYQQNWDVLRSWWYIAVIWLIIASVVSYWIFREVRKIDKIKNDKNKMDRAKLDTIVKKLDINPRDIYIQKIENDRFEEHK